MSNHQKDELRIPKQAGSELAVASNYCWTGYTIPANDWYLFSIYADGSTIIGAGINTHGAERVTATYNYPGSSSEWEIAFYNWEDHDVDFDLYAWFS